MMSSPYEPVEIEKELLKAAATGHFKHFLHVLVTNGNYFVHKRRKQGGHKELSDDDEQHCKKKKQQCHSSNLDLESDSALNEFLIDGHFSCLCKSEDDLTKKHKKYLDCSPNLTQSDVVREALSNVNINCKDVEGSTLLHHACYTGSLDLVEFLIFEGADVEAQDAKGDSPLHIAVRYLFENISVVLRQAGGDMHALNYEGVTPFHIEAKFKIRQKDNIEVRLKRQQKKKEDDPRKKERGPFPDWNDKWKRQREKRMQGMRILEEETALDKARWESILVEGKERYKLFENAWKKFSNSDNQFLSYSDVPFPVEKGKEAHLPRIILHDAPPLEYKQLLRKEILRWHPDKFFQKYGHKFCDVDLEQITERVNALSQALNQLYSDV